MNKVLIWMAMGLVVIAAVAGGGLLACDAGFVIGLPMALVSAVPLLAVGVAFLVIQPVIRPRWPEAVKNGLLAATFLLWGFVQLMAQNEWSRKLGDLVIALFVMDLTWTIFDRVKEARR
jgi:hypothetical protein